MVNLFTKRIYQVHASRKKKDREKIHFPYRKKRTAILTGLCIQLDFNLATQGRGNRMRQRQARKKEPSCIIHSHQSSTNKKRNQKTHCFFLHRIFINFTLVIIGTRRIYFGGI